MNRNLFPFSYEIFSLKKPYYFLSHFHRDHLRGLTPKFSKGIIFCSEITARYLKHFYQIQDRFLFPMNFFQIYEVEPGIKAWIYPANHSRGSAMLILQRSDGVNLLYSGDFRYDREKFQDFPFHLSFQEVYLDQTYADFPHDFPSQEDAIDKMKETILGRDWDEVFIGSYQTGKERIFETLGEQLQIRFLTSKEKLAYYQLSGLEYLFTRENTGFSNYSMGYLYRYLSPLKTKNSLVILPTGWTAENRNSSPHPHTLAVPYSEHCSRSELKLFLKNLNTSSLFDLHGNPFTF